MTHLKEKPRARRPSRLQCTAYHEAGHAVAYIELRLPFKYVTIVPGEDSLGHLRTMPTPPSFNPEINLDHRTCDRIERMIVAKFAGQAAEAKLTGRNNWRGSRNDFSDAAELGIYVGGDGDGTTLYLKWVFHRAKYFFTARYRWVAVEALAKELLKHKRLGSKRVRAVVREAMLPPSLHESEVNR